VGAATAFGAQIAGGLHPHGGRGHRMDFCGSGRGVIKGFISYGA